jgi:hypothetical protein
MREVYDRNPQAYAQQTGNREIDPLECFGCVLRGSTSDVEKEASTERAGCQTRLALATGCPSHGRDLASLYRDKRAHPNRRRDRNGLPNDGHFPSHHREPTSHKNGTAARSGAEPILNDGVPRANPNSSRPRL